MTPSVHAVVVWARRRRSTVVLAAVILTLAAAVGISRLRFDTDVLSLLPQDGKAIPAFRDYLRRFGGLDQLYIVFTAPHGQNISDYRGQIDAWVEALRKTPEIVRVDAGTLDRTHDWSWLADRQLLLLRGPRLDTALSRLQPDGMRAALLDSRALLSVPSDDATQLVRQDPLGFFPLLHDELGRVQAGLNIGAGPDGYVSSDGTRRLVVAQPVRPPFDTAFSHALVDRLQRLQTALTASPATSDSDDRLPPMDVEFAGGHRIAVETEQIVRREAIGNSVGSLALILPLLLLVFRSVWLVVVGAIPSALSLVYVLGGLGFRGATLSAAATGATAMMFGLGVDGVVLLYVTYQSALASGGGEAAIDERLSGASASMLLGMWTTAATFYGLMVVDFPSLTQLGALIGHSMAVCGIVTLLLVPALLPRRPSPKRRRMFSMRPFIEFLRPRRRPARIALAVVTIALALCAMRLRINPTLERLRSVSDAAMLELRIARAFGLPEQSLIVLDRGTDLDALLSRNERLTAELDARAPHIPLEAPSMLLPSLTWQRRVHERLRSLPAGAELAASLARNAEGAGFKPDALTPFAERLSRLTSQTTTITIEDYEGHGLGSLLARLVTRDGGAWMLATYVFPRSAAESASVEAAAAALGGRTVVTGLPLVNRELSAAFVPQFIRGVAIGTVLVIVMIAIAFRSWRLTTLAMLPTIVGLVWAAGLLGILGVELDLFAMFAVVTFVGIGVDYGVHLVHRYTELGDAEEATAELGPVILLAGAITVLGYGTLVTSSYPPLQSIGVVSAVSTVCLALASLLTLPLLLPGRGRG